MAFVLTNLSNMIIPALVFYIIAYGLASHCKIYEDFVKGAKEGLKTVVGIMPTLVALMIAVGVLRSSGFLDFLEELFVPVSAVRRDVYRIRYRQRYRLQSKIKMPDRENV